LQGENSNFIPDRVKNIRKDKIKEMQQEEKESYVNISESL